MTPPLRFLAVVVGGWCLARAGAQWWPDATPAQVASAAMPAHTSSRAGANASPLPQSESRAVAFPGESRVAGQGSWRGVQFASRAVFSYPAFRRDTTDPYPATSIVGDRPLFSQQPQALPATSDPVTRPAPIIVPHSPAVALASASPAATGTSVPQPAPALRPTAGRLNVGSWALWRAGEPRAGASLGPGVLGGSQAGVRATYQVAPERVPGLALSARLSTPLRRRGAEAAIGLEWQPSAAVPVRLLGERRQRISGEGRSAFALLAHGGVSEQPVALGFRLDAYGAAGVVGARRRDLFVEGSASITRALGPVRVGAGAWGGAQRGVSRLDVGPSLQLPVPLGPAGARLSLDYRLRVAGDAAPASGPTLTLGADF